MDFKPGPSVAVVPAGQQTSPVHVSALVLGLLGGAGEDAVP